MERKWGEIRSDAARVRGRVPWPGSAWLAPGRRAEAGGHAGVPSQASRSKGSLQCPALPAPGAQKPRPRGARGFRSLCAPGRESSGASRCSQQRQGAHDTGQGRRSTGARARVFPAPRHSQPRPERRGGTEGARAGRDSGGGWRPAPHECAEAESAQKRPASAHHTMA